jgi:hypothetical protein
MAVLMLLMIMSSIFFYAIEQHRWQWLMGVHQYQSLVLRTRVHHVLTVLTPADGDELMPCLRMAMSPDAVQAWSASQWQQQGCFKAWEGDRYDYVSVSAPGKDVYFLYVRGALGPMVSIQGQPYYVVRGA